MKQDSALLHALTQPASVFVVTERRQRTGQSELKQTTQLRSEDSGSESRGCRVCARCVPIESSISGGLRLCIAPVVIVVVVVVVFVFSGRRLLRLSSSARLTSTWVGARARDPLKVGSESVGGCVTSQRRSPWWSFLSGGFLALAEGASQVE
ncbi:uncharacterized protein PG986_009354 [Apiospora aurea]|uniref:Transmembrane protein n=1 Tax=Apiospora aurea TaxID=335848 RepID=A0ABR1Q7G3_9PEZI